LSSRFKFVILREAKDLLFANLGKQCLFAACGSAKFRVQRDVSYQGIALAMPEVSLL